MISNNYGDVIHHSPAIDLKVLSWLAEGKYVVDRAAPLASLERLKAQVEAYRLERVAVAQPSLRRSKRTKQSMLRRLMDASGLLRCARNDGTSDRLTIPQPRAGIGAEHRDPVDGQHHREGDHQHRDAEHRDRGEIAAFVEVVDQH